MREKELHGGLRRSKVLKRNIIKGINWELEGVREETIKKEIKTNVLRFIYLAFINGSWRRERRLENQEVELYT